MKLQKQVLLNLHSFNTIIVFEKTKSLDIEENELGFQCWKGGVRNLRFQKYQKYVFESVCISIMSIPGVDTGRI